MDIWDAKAVTQSKFEFPLGKIDFNKLKALVCNKTSNISFLICLLFSRFQRTFSV